MQKLEEEDDKAWSSQKNCWKDIITTYLVREDLVGRHSGKEPPPGIEIWNGFQNKMLKRVVSATADSPKKWTSNGK